MCRILKDRTSERHLVISGGVALNSVMNGRILREAGFDDIYVMPGAGDNGTCIGAACYVHHVTLDRPRIQVHDDPYVGTAYSGEQIENLLKASKIPYRKPANLLETAADYLAGGEILGWFQGRMEFGPRALGNRSILADPTDADMKRKLNAEVKHREAFRPFAPVVPVEQRLGYFDISVEAPFMLKVAYVKPDKRDVIPAVTHVDGTARVQTVRREKNERLHGLLNEFGRIRGTPVLLNTSFNVMGQPIVESPEQALRCFYTTGIDRLVLSDCIVSKTPETV